MNFFKSFLIDIGIDLGTCNTLVYIKDYGVVMSEPSVVAIDVSKGNRVVAVGRNAKKMLWKTPENIKAVRPLRDGVIADIENTEKMIKYFINQIFSRKKLFFKPRMVIGVPTCITEVERRAVKESAMNAGAREVKVIEESLAAAIGSDIPIFEPTGHMVCDIGGGTTEISVISLGGMVVSRAIRIGGDEFDESIIKYMRSVHNIVIGQQTAEKLKIKIGNVYPDIHNLKVETIDIKGTDAVTGLPKKQIIDSMEIRESLQEPISTVVDEVKRTLGATPPELATDIVERGIILTGGGALLKGLSRLLSKETGVPVYVADNPLLSVAVGAGLFYDYANRIDISKNIYSFINE